MRKLLWLLVLLLPSVAFEQTKFNQIPTQPGSVSSTDRTVDDNGTTTYMATFAQVLTFIESNLPTVTYLIDTGTTFTVSSGTGACASTSTLKGGSANGEFLCTGTAGASTIVVNLPTAPNGWACWANDDTSTTAWGTGSSTTTSIKLSGTIATTGDKVTFGCTGH